MRYILNSISEWTWVCRRIGMVPWYMVNRLTSSMCMSHVQPFVWEGMLSMVPLDMIVQVIGGPIDGSLEYH